MTRRIGVIGSGSWGTALAVHLAHTGHEVRLWARDGALAADMIASRQNRTYLPGIELPAALAPTHDMPTALDGAEFVVIAVPSHGVRDVAHAANAHLPGACAIVSATKGLEEGSMLRMSQVLRQELPDAGEIVVLSGPSFASELARRLPTALVAAGDSAAVVESVMAHFRSPALRLYGSSDVVGVELGGSLKNIIAIAAGVVEGLGLGHNAKAALITRGLAGTRMVAEGVRTTAAALALGAAHGIELPIASEMSDVLSGRTDPQTAIRNLMGRKQKLEHA
jgi:glycerol-3-phosphate dehydrogenase (NAD(P)+)